MISIILKNKLPYENFNSERIFLQVFQIFICIERINKR